MTSIPLFESLQNEMHRRMGCSSLGCFNEKERKQASHDPSTLPSSWPGGFLGFICEGNAPIGPAVLNTIASIFDSTASGKPREAQDKGEGMLNIEDIRASSTYGGNVEEQDSLSADVFNYPDASPHARHILEQEIKKGFGFATDEDARRFLDVASKMKRNEGITPNDVARIVPRMGRAFRSGSDGFYVEGVEGTVFPEKLWENPTKFLWEDDNRNVSRSFGTYKELGQENRGS